MGDTRVAMRSNIDATIALPNQESLQARLTTAIATDYIQVRDDYWSVQVQSKLMTRWIFQDVSVGHNEIFQREIWEAQIHRTRQSRAAECREKIENLLSAFATVHRSCIRLRTGKACAIELEILKHVIFLHADEPDNRGIYFSGLTLRQRKRSCSVWSDCICVTFTRSKSKPQASRLKRHFF